MKPMAISSNNTGDYSGLYLHVPFCRNKKCLYCDFYSIASLAMLREWFDAVLTESDLYSSYNYNCFKKIDTLYIGGGTPSILENKLLFAIIENIRNNFNLSADLEITLEANPNDITSHNLDLWHRMDINRISLGVQSIDDKVLLFLGRSHSSEDAMNAINIICEHGKFSLGIDLIYGYPGQSLSEWEALLKRIIEYNPAHLSCYQLTYEDATTLGKMKKNGLIKSLTEEEEYRFFMETSQYISGNGYLHYEVSNYAKTYDNISKHNLKYWQRKPYLGLGPSAHSFDGSQRWWNVSSIKRYVKMVSSGHQPIEQYEQLTDEQSFIETVSLGLRSPIIGICEDTLSQKNKKNIEQLIYSGHLFSKEGKFFPTLKGMAVADSLSVMLV